nr:immunoglobulin heavy chain junction region [Mus musculus]
CARVPHYFDYW